MPEAGFNIYESSITNQNIVVTYTPAPDVISYSYTIIKDNVPLNTINAGNKVSQIKLSDTGDYQIEITFFNGITYNKVTSGIYKIDKEAPTIKIKQDNIVLHAGEDYDILTNIKVDDNVDGDITNRVQSNIKDLDLTSAGSKELVYTVSDLAGNKTSQIVNLQVLKQSNLQLSISQLIIMVILLGFFIALFIYNRTIKLEKRLVRYTIRPLKDNSKSLFQIFNGLCSVLIDKITNVISKYEIAIKQSKKYEKYVLAFGSKEDKAIRFVGKKVFTSIIFLLCAFIVTTLRFQVLSIYEIVLLLVIGYYSLDILYRYRYYQYCKQVENDLLQAIIVMNNAFKSGRSITQAIELVGNELTGAISEEFKKMAMEISFGLDIEVVFKRFAERINVEEAAYLTSSLSILNKTGGNIIKVFTSIEKTLFNRKKLRIELKELTGSSKLIMWVLTIVPIAFALVISLINPEYFAPLLTNVLGFVIIGAIILLYVVYIIIVRKIMKIRM